eukprot:752248-Prorocentrum_minimum.AAC.1
MGGIGRIFRLGSQIPFTGPFCPSLTMRGLLPPTPSGTPPRGARLVRSPGEAGQRQGRPAGNMMESRGLASNKNSD